MLSYDQIEQVLYRAGFRMTRTHRIKKLLLRLVRLRGRAPLMAGPLRNCSAPRLYRTDIDILNSLSIDWMREEFEELRARLRGGLEPRPFQMGRRRARPRLRTALERVLRVPEPLGDRRVFRLPALRDVHKKLTDPTLGAIYKCMARDEARHSSFLNFVMRQMGRRFDLENLPKIKGMQYMHPKWIFVTTYLSEIVGFYRYQNISDHLKRQPEYRFHPIFRYFDNWCKDERRHSRFFALMLRSQPDFMRGPRNRFAIKFFTLAVYVTMYLRDSRVRSLRAPRHRLGEVRRQGHQRDRARRTRSVGLGHPDRLAVLSLVPAPHGAQQRAQQARAFGHGPRARRRARDALRTVRE